MKIRNGFVSNSSSSSFIIRGIMLKYSQLKKTWNLPNPTKEEKAEEFFDKDEFQQVQVEDYCSDNDIDVELVRDYDGCLLGYILGKSTDTPEMYEVAVVSDFTEEENIELIEKLEKTGLTVKKLETFFQYSGC